MPSFIKSFRLLITLPLALLLFLMYLKVYGVQFLNKDKLLPVLNPAPQFELVNQGNQAFSNQNLAGKVWVADFIFTRCGGICPMMTTHMKRLSEKLPKARFVSFSVDPEYDSPEILAAYAQGYGADTNRWSFLTGDKSKMSEVIAGFKLSPVDEPMMHSNRFVLVDKKGQVRGYYDSEDPAEMKKIIRDTHLLF